MPFFVDPDATSLLPDLDDGPLEDAKTRSPEEYLWLSVVYAAWRDAFDRSDVDIVNSDRNCDPELIRGDGRRWLVSDIEPWRSAREEICSYASSEETALCKLAKERLELERENDMIREEEQRESKKKHFDDRLQRLLQNADKHPGRVNQFFERLAEAELCAL